MAGATPGMSTRHRRAGFLRQICSLFDLRAGAGHNGLLLFYCVIASKICEMTDSVVANVSLVGTIDQVEMFRLVGHGVSLLPLK